MVLTSLIGVQLCGDLGDSSSLKVKGLETRLKAVTVMHCMHERCHVMVLKRQTGINPRSAPGAIPLSVSANSWRNPKTACQGRLDGF